jgi:chromosome partitioning protein
MQTIAVYNQKGGCGKTTTAINLAAALAEAGQRVLLVDLDPQSHATLGLGHVPQRAERTVYHLLVNEMPRVADAVTGTGVSRLDLIPGDARVATAELDLGPSLGKELVFKEQLRSLADRYDTCVIDCAPSGCLPVTGALVASGGVLIPVQARSNALAGPGRILETTQQLRQRFEPCSVAPLGVLLTFVEGRTKLSRRVEHDVRERFAALVFATTIRRTIKLAEAPQAGCSILGYAPRNPAADEYRALAREVIARLGAAVL